MAGSLLAQAPPEPTRDVLKTAPNEISKGALRVRFRSEIRIVPIVDHDPRQVVLDGSITLQIEVPQGIPRDVRVDRLWIMSLDETLAMDLQPTTQLARIDVGPWFASQQIAGDGPEWLAKVDSVDVVVRVLRESTVLGYLRRPATPIINLPRAAEAERARRLAITPRPGGTYFGAFLGGGLTTLQGFFDGNGWEHQTVAVNVFPPQVALQAMDRVGSSRAVRYDTIPVAAPFGEGPWEYRVERYDSTRSRWLPLAEPTCFDSLEARAVTQAFSAAEAQLRQECSDRLLRQTSTDGYGDATLFWMGPAAVRVVQPALVELDSVLQIAFERRGRELWSTALKEHDLVDRPSATRFGVRLNVRVDASIVGWWQVLIEYDGGSVDPRGSLFFVYSEASHRLLHASFGHPEWSPGSALLAIRPYIYFRIGDNPTVYCLVEYNGAWERAGVALFDLGAARPALTSW